VPTAFTHAFVGTALAAGTPAQVPRARLALALATLAVLPDLDVAAFALGIPYDHPLGHRGLSHSLPFAVLAALFATRLVCPALPRFSRPWWRVTALLALAAASHGLLDAFTDAGLGIAFFVPFSDARYFFPWRPLATSPIGVQAFFGGPVWGILANEAVWVWLPVASIAALGRLARRRPPLPGSIV
jgi:inner membrane protein